MGLKDRLKKLEGVYPGCATCRKNAIKIRWLRRDNQPQNRPYTCEECGRRAVPQVISWVRRGQ
jgi:hypothetical protein